jgi:hypothetical protein
MRQLLTTTFLLHLIACMAVFLMNKLELFSSFAFTEVKYFKFCVELACDIMRLHDYVYMTYATVSFSTQVRITAL